MGHEKPEICGDRFFIYEICGRDYYINDYIYNILIYKARKRKRCLYDLVKYGNYISISWENKYKTLLSSCRYKKIIIIILIGKRFEKGKEAAILLFKGIII